MRRLVYFLTALLFSNNLLLAQDKPRQLSNAINSFLQDVQLRYASVGLKVVNSETGAVVFALNPNTGLAPASCQKIITSASAMELLDPSFRYATTIAYQGTIQQGELTGDLHITGQGDPTLGSWRFEATKEQTLMQQWWQILRAKGIERIKGKILAHTDAWEPATVPGGWIWDDIGNYYGAGASALNWRENQYDVILSSGNSEGDPVSIQSTNPALVKVELLSELKAGKKGSGDNAYIYLAPGSNKGVIRGTIPPAENRFVIAGSIPDPAIQLMGTIAQKYDSINGTTTPYQTDKTNKVTNILYVHYSPVLDSINYWFMKRSINLYGECLLKTLAFEKTGYGSTEKGIEIIKDFWQTKGIDPASINLKDGSGLSPQNRVTVDALVQVLQYARTRPWFNQYYQAFPEFNKMKLKSGTIGGSKGFVGYHTAQDGTGYTVAFIVNNYSGSANELVKKMYQVLDVLK